MTQIAHIVTPQDLNNIVLNPINTSTMLCAAGYDPVTGTLVVQFIKGNKYRYRDVPEKTYAEMMAADSIGGYFLNHIKGSFGEPEWIPDEEPQDPGDA